jgi:hypothetical protein
MAEAFVVSGPCYFQMGANAVGLANVGLTDNDDLPSIDYEDFNEYLEATDTGREPGEVVYLGRVATINVVLAKWDILQIQEIARPPGAAADGEGGTVGSQWFDGDNFFAIKILPTTAGKTWYMFEKCWIDGSAFRHFDFGNTGQKLGIQIRATRDEATPANIYTTGTVGS